MMPTTRDRQKLIAGLVLTAGCALSPALLAQTALPPLNSPVALPAEPVPANAPPASAPLPDALPANISPEITGSIAPANGSAQPAPPIESPLVPPGEDPQAVLERMQNSLGISKERADALRREIDQLSGDRAQQNAQLIAAAQRVQTAEIEVQSMQERLDALIVAEFEVRGRLDGQNSNIANVLAALERISRNPPPALIVDPSDALGSARSAILMSTIFPQLQAKAAQVTADLARLSGIKSKALDEEAQLKANYAVLAEEQLRIATLILARKQGVEVVTAELEAEEEAAAALAARATSLKELIDTLRNRASDVAQSAGTPSGAPGGTSPNTPESVRLALANTARMEPALPFSTAKGYLTLPSGGVNVIDFGASDGFGGISSGLSVVTRAEAQVVAPADGWVMYKGPYLNYGQIIILNTGEDYTVLLAGLDTVTVNLGQFVLMGEPVGTMGSRTIGKTVATGAGNSRPTLYIELRKNNEPIDPTGWWASPINPVQSG